MGLGNRNRIDEVRPKCTVEEFIKDFANPTGCKSEAEKRSFYILRKSHKRQEKVYCQINHGNSFWSRKFLSLLLSKASQPSEFLVGDHLNKNILYLKIKLFPRLFTIASWASSVRIKLFLEAFLEGTRLKEKVAAGAGQEFPYFVNFARCFCAP